MKKFIAKLLLFILLVLGIVGIINVAYMQMDVSDKDDTKKFATIPAHIQICNFGSSHGIYDFNYVDFDDKYECFNFGLPSQRLSYDFRLLKNYQNHIGKGTIVFIPISYFSLFGKDEIESKEFLAKNKRYYRILPKELIKEYDIVLDVGMNYFLSLLVNPNDVIKAFIGQSSNFHEERWKKKSMEVNVAEDAKNACARHLKLDKFDENGNRLVNQEEIEALRGMIGICHERGAIPILVTVPFLEEYLMEIRKDATFYSDFYSLVNKISKETGTEYYDYAFDKRFTTHYDWFINSDHLNREGAKNFTNILLHEIVFKQEKYKDEVGNCS